MQPYCQRLAFFWAFLGAALAPAPLKFLALSFFCRIFSALLIFDLALMPACRWDGETLVESGSVKH